jgi:hypothetical protein
MANPYYIPRDNSRMQNFLGLATLAAQLYGMKQQGDIAERTGDINEEKNALTLKDIEQRGAYQGREATISEERNRLSGEQIQNERAKVPTHKQNYGYGDHALLVIQAKQFGTGDDNPLITMSKELADNKNVTKIDAYQAFHDNPEMQQATIDSLQKKMASGYNKNPNYLESREGKQDYAMLQAISTDEGWGKAVDSAFKNTVQSAKQEEMNSKAALLAAQGANRPVYPTVDQVYAGRLMSREMTPEQVGTLQHPRTEKAGTVVGPGASFIPQGATAPVYTNPNRAVQEPAPTIVPPGSSVLPRGATTPTYTAPERPEKGTTDASILKRREYARKAESSILDMGKTKGQPNVTEEDRDLAADAYNQNSDKSYVYIKEAAKESNWYGGTNDVQKYVKKPLPMLDGQQVTAMELWFSAAKHGLTLEQAYAAALEQAKKKRR